MEAYRKQGRLRSEIEFTWILSNSIGEILWRFMRLPLFDLIYL